MSMRPLNDKGLSEHMRETIRYAIEYGRLRAATEGEYQRCRNLNGRNFLDRSSEDRMVFVPTRAAREWWAERILRGLE